MKDMRIEIKPQILIWIFGSSLALYLAYQLRSVIVLFAFSFILSTGLRPLVNRLEVRKVPRILSLILIYLIGFIFLFIVINLTVGTFVDQIKNLVTNLPSIIQNVLLTINAQLPQGVSIVDQATIDNLSKSTNQLNSNNFNLEQILSLLTQNFSSVGTLGFGVVGKFVDVIFSSFIVLITAAYLTVKKDKIYDPFLVFFHKSKAKKIKETLLKVERSLGEWLVGQLVLMIIIGLLSYLAIIFPRILGIEGYNLFQFALLIGIIAGILEALPNIGPALTIFVTILLALGSGESPAVILYVLVMFVLIQQLEGLFIVPSVMKKAVDLDPIITIIAITAGLQLYGILGAILSIPVIVTIKIIAFEVAKYKGYKVE